MADPFLGEIRIFAQSRIPTGWLACDGQILSIFQYGFLYSLLGTTYGGDGRTTFGLPDLRGRIPLNQGQLPGGENYVIGRKIGYEKITLNENQMPIHSHELMVTSTSAKERVPADHVIAATPVNTDPKADPDYVFSSEEPDVAMMAESISKTGGGQPIENRMPYITLCYCIAIQGTSPHRPE